MCLYEVNKKSILKNNLSFFRPWYIILEIEQILSADPDQNGKASPSNNNIISHIICFGLYQKHDYTTI